MARGGMHSKETATEANGTHPTGMHSCCVMFLTFNLVFDRIDLYLKTSEGFRYS